MLIIETPYWLNPEKFKCGNDIIKYFKKCIKSNPDRYYIREYGIITQLIDNEFIQYYTNYSML